MPASFGYPAGADAWVPLALPAKFQGNNFLRLIGRLKPGNSLSQAADDLHAISTAYNQANGLKRDVKVYSLHEYLVARNRRMLLVMQGAVAFVLLIACANVANLLLARSVSRVRELAIRAAIGAGRFRLVRQLLTESLLLSAGGSVAWCAARELAAAFVPRAGADELRGVQTIRDRYAGPDLHADRRIRHRPAVWSRSSASRLASSTRTPGFAIRARAERRARAPRAPAEFWSSRKSAWRWCW